MDYHGVFVLIPSMAAAIIHNFPTLFLVILLISAGTAMTGLDSILVFAALVLLVQVPDIF